MKCPHCSHEFDLTMVTYLTSHHGRYVCPRCAESSRLNLSLTYGLVSFIPCVGLVIGLEWVLFQKYHLAYTILLYSFLASAVIALFWDKHWNASLRHLVKFSDQKGQRIIVGGVEETVDAEGKVVAGDPDTVKVTKILSRKGGSPTTRILKPPVARPPTTRVLVNKPSTATNPAAKLAKPGGTKPGPAKVAVVAVKKPGMLLPKVAKKPAAPVPAAEAAPQETAETETVAEAVETDGAETLESAEHLTAEISPEEQESAAVEETAGPEVSGETSVEAEAGEVVAQEDETEYAVAEGEVAHEPHAEATEAHLHEEQAYAGEETPAGEGTYSEHHDHTGEEIAHGEVHAEGEHLTYEGSEVPRPIAHEEEAPTYHEGGKTTVLN